MREIPQACDRSDGGPGEAVWSPVALQDTIPADLAPPEPPPDRRIGGRLRARFGARLGLRPPRPPRPGVFPSTVPLHLVFPVLGWWLAAPVAFVVWALCTTTTSLTVGWVCLGASWLGAAAFTRSRRVVTCTDEELCVWGVVRRQRRSRSELAQVELIEPANKAFLGTRSWWWRRRYRIVFRDEGGRRALCLNARYLQPEALRVLAGLAADGCRTQINPLTVGDVLEAYDRWDRFWHPLRGWGWR